MKVVKTYDSKYDTKNPLEPTLLGRLIGMLLYPIKVVVHDYCYLGALRLTSPAYKEHLYLLDQQTQHLDGLHSGGPDPDCKYCSGIAEHVANGGYYRPWFEAGQQPS
jgi:hypothetical protein